jgi:ribosomal protein S18 acetylase RimI-like enzyme
MEFREARVSDAAGIAALHADSWRRHYRGAFSDAFLDGDVVADRLQVWSERLAQPDDGSCTIVAIDGEAEVVGLAHTIFDADPTLGALVDNLHVVLGLKRRGVGTRLMAVTAEAVVGRRPGSGLYLRVLEQNTAAQAFYDAIGGARVGRELVSPPGGVPDRLHGAPSAFVYSWPDPSVLSATKP